MAQITLTGEIVSINDVPGVSVGIGRTLKNFEAVPDTWKGECTGIGQDNSPVEPAKQFHPQSILECADLMAHSPRRNIQLFRGLGKAEVPGGSLEGAQAI